MKFDQTENKTKINVTFKHLPTYGWGPNQSTSAGGYTFTRRSIILLLLLYRCWTAVSVYRRPESTSIIRLPAVSHVLFNRFLWARLFLLVTRPAAPLFVTGSNKSQKLSFTRNVTRFNAIDLRRSNVDNNIL